jgi:hypothetical protein
LLAQTQAIVRGSPFYHLHDPALAFPFPWVTTTAGARWLDALVHRVPWDRCGVAQRYFPSVEEIQAVNEVVPGLGTQTPEGWYIEYVVHNIVEGLGKKPPLGPGDGPAPRHWHAAKTLAHWYSGRR